MVGISVEYRLLRQQGVSVFDAVADSRPAVRYLRAHAPALGIDPARIVVTGGSAGAHLAVGTALFDGIDTAGEDTSVPCSPDLLAFEGGKHGYLIFDLELFIVNGEVKHKKTCPRKSGLGIFGVGRKSAGRPRVQKG